MHKTFAAIILFSVFVTSCSEATPTPSSTQVNTPAPTQTAIPTFTPIPFPTQTPDFITRILPSGIPDQEWNGIPVMPAAINGEGDEHGYTFTVQASVQEIQGYYEAELAGIGASLFSAGEGSEKNSVLLIFLKGQELITVSIIPHEGLMVVLLVK
jgi:hypothetical protein